MSQALFSIILGFFHLILPSIPYTSFVNDGHRVESSIVTLFSVKPLILSPSNRFKASTCNGDINGRELNLQCRRGLSLLSINGFLGNGRDLNPTAIQTKLKSSILCLFDSITPKDD